MIVTNGIIGVFVVVVLIPVVVIPDAGPSGVLGRTPVLVVNVEEVAVRSSMKGADDG